MKKSKIVTPTLLFLMVILLGIAVYFNILYKPIQTKIDSLSFQNDLVKNQRIEIEIAFHDLKQIKSNITELKKQIKEKSTFDLLEGSMLADDIAANARNNAIVLKSINIGEPNRIEGVKQGSRTLAVISTNLVFSTTYEKGAAFVKGFEKSQQGAYKVTRLNITADEGDIILWDMYMDLYYYGDVEAATLETQSKSFSENKNNTDGNDVTNWIQAQ